jgi:hypothetical protein
VQTPPRGVEAEGTGTSRFRTGGLTCGGSARRDRWPLEPRAQEARTVRGHPAGCAPAMAVHPRRWPDRRDGVRPGAAAHSSHKQSFVRPLLAKSQGTFVGFCTVTIGRPEFSPIGYMEACRSFRQKATAAYASGSTPRRIRRGCAPWCSARRRCQLAGNMSGVACARSWRMIAARGTSKCSARRCSIVSEALSNRSIKGRVSRSHGKLLRRYGKPASPCFRLLSYRVLLRVWLEATMPHIPSVPLYLYTIESEGKSCWLTV